MIAELFWSTQKLSDVKFTDWIQIYGKMSKKCQNLQILKSWICEKYWISSKITHFQTFVKYWVFVLQ